MKKLLTLVVLIATVSSAFARMPRVGLSQEMAKCQAVGYALSAALKLYVDVAESQSCTKDSDCAIARTLSFCGGTVVNKVAAAGYELYFEDERVQKLIDEKRKVCGMGPVGMCRPFNLAVCNKETKTCVGKW